MTKSSAKAPPKIRSAYERRDRSAIVCPPEDDRTHQAMKNECDINTIMSRYEKTGIIEHVSRYGQHYGDFADVPDFHTAMTIVTNAQQMFDSLPSGLRARFGNDPGSFVDFVLNDENLPEMEKLGLVNPSAEQETAEPSPAPKPAPEPENPPAAE